MMEYLIAGELVTLLALVSTTRERLFPSIKWGSAGNNDHNLAMFSAMVVCAFFIAFWFPITVLTLGNAVFGRGR